MEFIENELNKEQMDFIARSVAQKALEDKVVKNKSVLAGIAKMQASDFHNFLAEKRSIPEAAYIRLALYFKKLYDMPFPPDIGKGIEGLASPSINVEEEYYPIPIRRAYGSMGGGSPEGSREVTSYISIKIQYLRHKTKNLSKLYFVRGEGDSMVPTIPANALVLIDESQREIQTGKVFYVMYNNEYYIKRIIQNFQTGEVQIISDKDHSTMVVGEQDSFEIIGLALMQQGEL